MKRLVIISVIFILVFIIASIITAIIISFTVVKPTTEAINQKLAEHFAKIVRIPKGILPPNIGFDLTSYSWEMETIEKEVTGIKFSYNPAFVRNQSVILATLEMPEGGDVSIFNKVLGAVVSDKQSLNSALDIEKANLSANQDAGYSKINLSVKPETKQTIKITWEYDKSKLGNDLSNDYTKLAKYPPSLLGIFYGLPHLIIGLLGG